MKQTVGPLRTFLDERRDLMISSFFSLASKAVSSESQATTDRYVAWIDGVGAWLILTGSSVSLGRVNGNVSPLIKTPVSEPEADIALVANLSRSHASIQRIDENYVLSPKSSVQIKTDRSHTTRFYRTVVRSHSAILFGFPFRFRRH